MYIHIYHYKITQETQVLYMLYLTSWLTMRYFSLATPHNVGPVSYKLVYDPIFQYGYLPTINHGEMVVINQFSYSSNYGYIICLPKTI